MIDVLIIGSGGAGLSAALEAKKNCENVVVLSKTYPTMSQTSQAQGGINAILNNSKDTVQNHIDDTIKSAHSIGDIDTIKYMCENSKETISWLDDIGVPFSRDENNNIAQRKLGGALNPRACYSSDYTGLKILHTLYDTCLKEYIEFISENMLLNFIVDNGVVKGITSLDIATSEVKQILAKKVVVASGGYAGIYSGFTTNSTATTGDAIAAALRVGCEVSNMEYIQFHPTSMRGNCILISESARGEGGYLVTKDEKRFVDELQARDVVARAIYEKIQDEQEVYLDLRHLGLEKIKESMPQEYDLALQFSGLKLDQDLIPIQPAAHYTMGGIKTNLEGETNIKNLYAIGECSSNGVHGANRLGGNSLLEIVTFGRLVGKNVSLDSKEIVSIENKEYSVFINDKKNIEDIFDLESKVDFYDKRQIMGKLFYEDVGLFRTQESLQKVFKEIKSWEHELKLMGISDKSRVYNTNLKELLEFQNMLDLCDAIVISALARKESRGAHYRLDYTSESADFQRETTVSKKQDKILVELV
ncbi:MAG: FAD-dependent oxidoreductase [Campylobacterota bacterium]|nr:FAD-dependent oxidoreductase [Campylobacterota bacterium]